jgi:hypothetical protein
MSHYLAERLASLETLDDEERHRAQDEVADLIIRLWSHRQGAPLRTHPLGSVEAVERALERLDPQRPAWGYYRYFELEDAPSDALAAVLPPLQLALHLDRAIGDLVRDLIAHAASIAQSADAEWLLAVRAAEEYPERRLRNLEAIIEKDAEAVEPPDAADRATRDIARSAERCIELLAGIPDAMEGASGTATTQDRAPRRLKV